MTAKLGNYTLVRTLGSGANSKVKLGYNEEEQKHYAIKILKANQKDEDEKAIETFMHEVTAMKNLSHPNIVNMKDFSRDGIMEKNSKS